MKLSATGLTGRIFLYSSPFIAFGLWGFLLSRLPLKNISFDLAWQFCFFLLLTIGAGLSPVKLPRGGVMTVAFALDFAGILIFGPTLAAGIAAASAPFVLRKTPPFKLFWNAGQIVFTVLAAGYVYAWAKGEFIFRQDTLTFTPVDYSRHIYPLLLSGVAYVVVNTLAVAGAISASTNRPLFGVWIVSFRWMAVRFLAVAPFGILMAMVFQIKPEAMKVVVLLLFFVPLLLARWAFKGSMGMLEVYNQTIYALSKALEAYDPYTRNHSERVTLLAEKIARQMHLPEPKIEALVAAGRLHDMGKCRYDWETIIRKPGKPSEEEWQVIRCHPLDGAQIASEIQVPFLPSIADIVRSHHERVDGSGYPTGAKGEEIDITGRILCAADAFEAITSRRSYQNRRGVDDALAELQRNSGRQFDPKVVEAVAAIVAQGPEALAFLESSDAENE
jgi:putative nucleotidyltransferase with HDIG domain